MFEGGEKDVKLWDLRYDCLDNNWDNKHVVSVFLLLIFLNVLLQKLSCF